MQLSKDSVERLVASPAPLLSRLVQGLCFFQTKHVTRRTASTLPESPPVRRLAPPPSARAGAAMAMSSIRSALARALVAPKLQAPRRFAATAAAGETQPERVAAEMVRYALGGAVHRSSPGFPLPPLPFVLVRFRFLRIRLFALNLCCWCAR